MEGPDRVGQTVDVALGSRSLRGGDSQAPRGAAWRARCLRPGLQRCARGTGRVGTGRPRALGYSYPRSSSDSKMSVSMRSHSMLVVFKFPSPEAPLFAGNAYTGACAASPELPSRRLAPQPPHCACPERAQDTWSRPSPRPCRLRDGQEAAFCTCVLPRSEAGSPKKGRRTGCVAAGRGDQATGREGGLGEEPGIRGRGRRSSLS